MSGRRPAQDGANGHSDAKRPRTDAPAKPAFDIASIRAQIAAKKAALEAGNGNGSSSPSPAPPPPIVPPSSSRSPAPPPPTNGNEKSTAPGPGPAGPASMPPKPSMDASVAERLAAAKARIEALNARSRAGTSAPTAASTPAQPAQSVALHPLLVGSTQAQGKEEKNEKRKERDRYKTMAPKYSTVRANAAVAASSAPPIQLAPAPAPELNPYASSSSTPLAPEEGRAPARKSKKLQFSQPGRYVRQGDVLRNEEKMEALRQRIAEASRKAGLDSEFDTLERSLKRQPPPEVEWWDKAIMPEDSTYDDLEKAVQYINSAEDPPITHLVQHPIPIAAPWEKKQPERGLMLTKKEQKKMRRQRRKAELEDKQDRQKMGLIPPDPPKVKLANMMKVLTSDAVADPTKVEARIRKEVQARADKHENDNQERKLTAEQRKQKEYDQLVARERRGIFAAAYKIKNLSNGRHKFKVRQTAQQDQLSGLCIYHPSFALVLVEGTDKGIKHYRQLMEHRIDWTEQVRPRGEDGELDGTDEAAASKEPEDLADNRCDLIWSGEVPDRAFKFFKSREAETDHQAKEWLTQRYEGYWDLAKRHVWSGDDF